MNLSKFMHDAGIRRLRFSKPFEIIVDGEPLFLDEIELYDTIPAPPPFEGELETEPEKPPGTCIAFGCMEPGGWHFDRRYCGPHGRSAAGVKP